MYTGNIVHALNFYFSIDLVSFAISLISVFAGYSYYAISPSLVVEIHTCALRMHSYTLMIYRKSLVLLGTPNISHAQPVSLSFGRGLRICAWDRCSAGSNTARKSRMRGGYGEREF